MWLQITSSYFYRRVHDILSYPVIVITSFSTIVVMTPYNGTSYNTWFKYVLGILSLISGVLTVVTRHIQPGEMHEHYSHTGKRYQTLIRKIDTCLDLPEDMRKPPQVFIESIKTEIEAISEHQLYPPVYVIKLFEKKFGNIDQKMFGENIIELIKADIRNRRQARRIMKLDNASSLDTSHKSSQLF